MKIKLLSMNDGFMQTVKTATSKCYDSAPSMRAVEKCVKSGHWSVLEHAWLSFDVQEVSRALLAQITRHRHLSFTVRSQRYCKENSFGYVVPPSIEANPEAKAKYDECMAMIRQVYTELLEKGIPEEDARYVLPNATFTTFVVSGNLRAWLEFLKKRLCARAQWEIRKLAEAIFNQLEEFMPVLINYAHPCSDCKEIKCPKGG